jgi:phospholipid/cholesterol/gamma-HCH transport system substrate-binding protein
LTQSTNRTIVKGNVAAKLSDTVDKLNDATNNLDQITSDLHKFTSDPKVDQNLRTTVDNIAQTTTSTKILVARITSLVGGHVQPRGSGQSAFLANLDFSQNFATKKFRTDFDLYAPISSSDFVRAGIFDITERNYLNLQYGTTLPYNRDLDARAGVYAGKVGVGLDYHLFRNNNLSMDLYDPNRLHLDLKARVRLSNQAALIIGGEDLTRDSGAVVGVELRR